MSEEKGECYDTPIYKLAQSIINTDKNTTEKTKLHMNKSMDIFTKDCLECKNNGNYSSCHDVAKNKLYRSLPFIKDNIYPWKNYEWNYGNYIDNNYSPLATGAKTEGSFSAMVNNLKALKKIGDGYLFTPNPGEKSFSGIFKNGQKIEFNNKELLNSDVPYYECNGQIIDSKGEPKNLSEDDKKLCRAIQNIKYSDEFNPPYDDPFFKENLDGRHSSSYFVKIGYCKKNNISKEECIRNGFKWISDNKTCYKPRYAYINNEPGIKFAATRMDGLLPSLAKDVTALSPDKILNIMKGHNIEGHFKQQDCEDNENFINYKKQNISLSTYSIFLIFIILYIIFLVRKYVLNFFFK